MKKTMLLTPVLLSLATGALAQGTAPYAGLWVGTVSVDKVSQSQYIIAPAPNPCPTPSGSPPVTPPCVATQGTSIVPTPVGREFTFRIIVHIDASGTARLLKDVIQMWKPGVGGAPGHFVLVTDPTLIPTFSGVALRDGDPVAKRLGAPAIDFPATAPDYAVTMAGSVSTPGTGTLTASFTIDRNHPTNPFKHKYHPDHDNVGPFGPVPEAFDVTRTIQLAFSSTDPTGASSPEYGSSVLAGTYGEQFPAGALHKNPIAVSGSFRLTRVSLTARLNQ